MADHTLFEQLYRYQETDFYPFHMPGHKRNRELLAEMCSGKAVTPFDIDITEIDGFDNLHHAEGILKEVQEYAAQVYGAKESFFLINGSTCGLLAAVFACTEQGGTLLMARNCHKAVYHAAELRELHTTYLYPTVLKEGQINGRIRPEDVERELSQDHAISAVLVTSPSYDGIVSDIKKIASIAHKYGKPLIVDEAHGAHFGFHPYFPENSLKLGADIVIHSLHKTLPSMTQTALLQVGEDSSVSSERIRKYLGIFETSSPSYVMMAGMDLCMHFVAEKKEELFGIFSERLQRFYEKTKELEHISFLKDTPKDPSKIVIFADGYDGQELADQLRHSYHLEAEMAAKGYVVALTSIFDTAEGLERLYRALKEIDEGLSKVSCNGAGSQTETCRKDTPDICMKNEIVSRISKAAEAKKRVVPLQESEGEISAEYLYLYPPGIPLIVPGERISRKLIGLAQEVLAKGFELQGIADYSGGNIQIIDINA